MSALLQISNKEKQIKEKIRKEKHKTQHRKTEQILQWTILKVFQRRKRDGKK